MTQQQFKNYKFSTKTRVLIDGEWRLIFVVNFTNCTIEIAGKVFSLDSIEDIREEL